MGVGARQIYATFMNITIFRNVLRLAWNVIFDVAKKLMSVCYGSTMKKRTTCSTWYMSTWLQVSHPKRLVCIFTAVKPSDSFL